MFSTVCGNEFDMHVLSIQALATRKIFLFFLCMLLLYVTFTSIITYDNSFNKYDYLLKLFDIVNYLKDYHYDDILPTNNTVSQFSAIETVKTILVSESAQVMTFTDIIWDLSSALGN